jgi:NADH-quinone oxidoreductase subunit F
VDLKISSSVATSEERAAVDAVIGAPAPDEPGAVRGNENLRSVRGGAALRGIRHQLLPVLHSVNDRVGWISRGAINYVAERMDVAPAEVYGVASFYALFSMEPRERRQVHACVDLACRAMGGPREEDLPEGVHPSPCLGACERAPAALVMEAGATVRHALAAPLASGELASLAGGAWPSPESAIAVATPQVARGDASLVLLQRVGRVDPSSLVDYRENDGYRALARAIEIGPEAVVAEVTASGLVGRGGAAFPTGRKWQAVAGQPVTTRHLVCNADESEPGTFKDRVVLEGDPFSLIEAMTIAAYATGCAHGWIYLRGEYPRALASLERAIAACRAEGLLGDDVLGAGFSFDITIIRGAGAYICGEETAIFNSIEGYRGEPRNKPPFPVEVGLFGKPTVINNVETLVNVPHILLRGGAEWAAQGSDGSKGRKLFCVSGAVREPGVYEVEFGPTLRDLIELAGGMRAGSELGAVLLGGAAGGFVGPDELDLPLTMEATRAAGATLGSGVVLVLDRSVDMVDQLRRIAAFFRDESCGQCVPCRVGTVRQEEIVSRLARGATAADLALLRDVGQVMRDASICGLGQTANNAIDSAIARLGVLQP